MISNGTATAFKLETICLKKDIDDLFAARKSLVRSGNQTSTLSSLYLVRELPQGSAPIMFLLHAPKKFISQAHQRNRVKRRMREAIRRCDDLYTIVSELLSRELQVLLVIRADHKPSKKHGWNEINADIQVITTRLAQRVLKSGVS